MIDALHVRVGTPDDVDAIMRLALAACEENGFRNPSPRKLLNDIWPALHRNFGMIGIIGETATDVQGAILLRIGEMWYTEEPILEEKAIFIDPNYRNAKGGRARKLAEFAKKTADQLGMPLSIGVLSNHRTEGKVRLYERMFGKPAGAYFLYGARTGEWKDAAE